MIRFKRLNNTGDTIVEVLIVLAILGLALSIAYATANKGLQRSRNAQEHSQSLGIINSQIELLRSGFAGEQGKDIEKQGGEGAFCLSSANNSVKINPITNTGENAFNDKTLAHDPLNSDEYGADCFKDDLYGVSIVGRGGGVYDVRVRWDGIGSLGRQQEELTYKLGNVIAADTGGYTDAETPEEGGEPLLLLSFTTSENEVEAGGDFRLQWGTNPHADSCTASGDWSGSVEATGTKDIEISSDTSPKTLKYTLTCTLGTQPPATQTIQINVTVYKPKLSILYRRYTPNWYDHFYTTDATEGDPVYTTEGNVGSVDTEQGPGEIPLYGLYSDAAGDHFYTTSSTEVDSAKTLGYTGGGVVGYIMPISIVGRGAACPAGTQPLYRMFSSYLGDHFYTTNFSEYTAATDKSWGGRNMPGPNPPTNVPGYDFSRRATRPWANVKWYNYAEGITGCTFKNV